LKIPAPGRAAKRDGENYMGRQSHVLEGGTPPSKRRREMGKPAQNHEGKVSIFKDENFLLKK